MGTDDPNKPHKITLAAIENLKRNLLSDSDGTDYIADLRAAILNLHGCVATYLETVPVTETFQGKTVWQGDVEVFEIRGHPQATHVYAWSHKAGKNDKETRYITVLQIPPVTSPETAVRAAIAAEIKNAREKTKGR